MGASVKDANSISHVASAPENGMQHCRQCGKSLGTVPEGWITMRGDFVVKGKHGISCLEDVRDIAFRVMGDERRSLEAVADARGITLPELVAQATVFFAAVLKLEVDDGHGNKVIRIVSNDVDAQGVRTIYGVITKHAAPDPASIV